MNFLKKLRKPQDDDSEIQIAEYQENMDSAYRKAARDEDEEASMRAILQVNESTTNPVPASTQDRVNRLDHMKAEGLLTDAEYEQLMRDIKK